MVVDWLVGWFDFWFCFLLRGMRKIEEVGRIILLTFLTSYHSQRISKHLISVIEVKIVNGSCLFSVGGL